MRPVDIDTSTKHDLESLCCEAIPEEELCIIYLFSGFVSRVSYPYFVCKKHLLLMLATSHNE